MADTIVYFTYLASNYLDNYCTNVIQMFCVSWDCLCILSGLTEIVEEGDFEAIYREVDRLRDTSLRPHLMFDTTQAESRADQLRREHKSRGKHPVVLMDQAAMSELRRFHNPPEAVKQMMKGVFLLLGEDEVTTSVS